MSKSKVVATNARNVILSATTMSQLSDGYCGKIFDAVAKEITDDLDNRGKRDGITRILKLEIALTPEADGRVEVGVKCSAKLPPLVPPKTICRLNKAAGGLFFNPELAENPDQLTIPSGEEDAE